MNNDTLTTDRKALQINLDADKYGTFAEIGAGQEVARWFFHVGGAAGTVAKTISAYDMAVSDAIYGPAERYVSRQRLQAMLQYEFDLLLQRLDTGARRQVQFFRVRQYRGDTQLHPPGGRPWLAGHPVSGRTAQRAVGNHHPRPDARQGKRPPAGGAGRDRREPDLRRVLPAPQPDRLIRSLLDNLTWERVEVDMIRFGGPAFAGVDNRLMALQLVEHDLTEAAMFTAAGETVQWNEVLHKSPCWSSAAVSAP